MGRPLPESKAAIRQRPHPRESVEATQPDVVPVDVSPISIGQHIYSIELFLDQETKGTLNQFEIQYTANGDQSNYISVTTHLWMQEDQRFPFVSLGFYAPISARDQCTADDRQQLYLHALHQVVIPIVAQLGFSYIIHVETVPASVPDDAFFSPGEAAALFEVLGYELPDAGDSAVAQTIDIRAASGPVA